MKAFDAWQQRYASIMGNSEQVNQLHLRDIDIDRASARSLVHSRDYDDRGDPLTTSVANYCTCLKGFKFDPTSVYYASGSSSISNPMICRPSQLTQSAENV